MVYKFLILLVLTSSFSASLLWAFDDRAKDTDDLIEARKLAERFSKSITTRLKEIIKEEGTVNAIEKCHLEAPDLARDFSQEHHWNVRRTSLKVRDLENAPDKWELSVLEHFEKQNTDEVDEDLMEYSEIVVNKEGNRVFRYMKAISTQRFCLKCHGKKIDSKVRKQLDSLFPFDQATDFTEDDLRGAFSLSKPLDIRK